MTLHLMYMQLWVTISKQMLLGNFPSYSCICQSAVTLLTFPYQKFLKNGVCDEAS